MPLLACVAETCNRLTGFSPAAELGLRLSEDKCAREGGKDVQPAFLKPCENRQKE